MLSIHNLIVDSSRDKLVRGISLELQAGGWLALAGESGSGKSLTAASIGGLLSKELKQSGIISWQGTDLADLSPSRKRQFLGKEISYIFQDYQGAFTPFMTIGKQLDEQLLTHTALNRTQRRVLSIEALVNVSLSGERVYGSYPSELSGGQLQRAAIASALILNPALMIADEPTTALDSLTAHKVLTYISKARARRDMSVLWITHDLRHVRRYADHVAIMLKGEIVEQGAVDQVLNAPAHSYTQQLIAAIPPLSPHVPRRLGLPEGVHET
ncbi:ABC transporter ATP-binding protein [Paenibacillus sinopodophylli]|uniref:ABC transporter ATP-binding protein n=1 Tax=Paenibacillus sinopodophylli TaxID=1837342 RepID=UPI00110D04F4|nr:ABC transporter ATP-binding protein [Paenibacillus sinopodophylli]